MFFAPLGRIEDYPNFDYLVGINCGRGPTEEFFHPDLYIYIRHHTHWISQRIPKMKDKLSLVHFTCFGPLCLLVMFFITKVKEFAVAHAPLCQDCN